MRGRSVVLGALGASLVLAAPAAAQTPPGAAKNVQLMKTITEAKNATAINFLEYKDKDGWGRHRTLDVMLVTGRFGAEDLLAREPGQAAAARRAVGRAAQARRATRTWTSARPTPRPRSRRSGRTRTWTSTRTASC